MCWSAAMRRTADILVRLPAIPVLSGGRAGVLRGRRAAFNPARLAREIARLQSLLLAPAKETAAKLTAAAGKTQSPPR